MAIDKQKAWKLYPTVGVIDGRQVMRWGPASKCDENCPLFKLCSYSKKGSCSIEKHYMNAIFDMLITSDSKRGIFDKLDDIELWRVGFHLIPLYHQLIRMKKVAYAVEQIAKTDKKGVLKIHPVFSEIRAIIKDVAKEIRDLRLNEKWAEKFGGEGGGPRPGPSMEEMMENGDPNYYDEMAGTKTPKGE